MSLRTFAAFLFATTLAVHAQQSQQIIQLWPHGAPEPTEATAPESKTPQNNRNYPNAGTFLYSNITDPTLTLYPVPAGVKPTGAAAIVFPGGGYQHLAWIHEGVMPCQWFNSLGIFCAIVKYRIPWKEHFPDTYGPLEDAQQAVRIVRAHATAWNLDPHRIGVLGFSAGGHLSVVLSQHYDDPHVLSTPAASAVDPKISARPDFVLLGYPAYLDVPTGRATLDPNLTPNEHTPPTFIVQSEDDIHYGDSSLVYACALREAHVPEEFILYPDGGHGYGMNPPGYSPEHWPDLASAWLHTIKILP